MNFREAFDFIVASGGVCISSEEDSYSLTMRVCRATGLPEIFTLTSWPNPDDTTGYAWVAPNPDEMIAAYDTLRVAALATNWEPYVPDVYGDCWILHTGFSSVQAENPLRNWL